MLDAIGLLAIDGLVHNPRHGHIGVPLVYQLDVVPSVWVLHNAPVVAFIHPLIIELCIQGVLGVECETAGDPWQPLCRDIGL